MCIFQYKKSNSFAGEDLIDGFSFKSKRRKSSLTNELNSKLVLNFVLLSIALRLVEGHN